MILLHNFISPINIFLYIQQNRNIFNTLEIPSMNLTRRKKLIFSNTPSKYVKWRMTSVAKSFPNNKEKAEMTTKK